MSLGKEGGWDSHHPRRRKYPTSCLDHLGKTVVGREWPCCTILPNLCNPLAHECWQDVGEACVDGPWVLGLEPFPDLGEHQLLPLWLLWECGLDAQLRYDSPTPAPAGYSCLSTPVCIPAWDTYKDLEPPGHMWRRWWEPWGRSALLLIWSPAVTILWVLDIWTLGISWVTPINHTLNHAKEPLHNMCECACDCTCVWKGTVNVWENVGIWVILPYFIIVFCIWDFPDLYWAFIVFPYQKKGELSLFKRHTT